MNWTYYVPALSYLVGAWFFIWALLRAAAKPTPKPPRRRSK